MAGDSSSRPHHDTHPHHTYRRHHREADILSPREELDNAQNKEESAECGKALRKDVSRSSHAAWTPSSDRPDPVELLRSQGETRVQALLPLRYGRFIEALEAGEL